MESEQVDSTQSWFSYLLEVLRGNKMVLRRKHVYLKSRSESRASQPSVCNPRLEYSDWPSADLDLCLSLET